MVTGRDYSYLRILEAELRLSQFTGDLGEYPWTRESRLRNAQKHQLNLLYESRQKPRDPLTADQGLKDAWMNVAYPGAWTDRALRSLGRS